MNKNRQLEASKRVIEEKTTHRSIVNTTSQNMINTDQINNMVAMKQMQLNQAHSQEVSALQSEIQNLKNQISHLQHSK